MLPKLNRKRALFVLTKIDENPNSTQIAAKIAACLHPC